MKNCELKIAGIAAGVTCLLFTSGFLVLFTPFPIYFVSTVYGKGVRQAAVIITAAAALFFYLLLFPLLYNLSGDWSAAQLMLMLPGVGLADFFGVGSVQYFGLLYLVYFLMFGYLFSEGMFKKWSLARWFAVSVGTTFALAAFAVLIPGAAGVSVTDGLREYMQGMLNELVKAQEAAGISGERVYALKQHAGQIVKTSLGIIPSVVLLIGFAVAAVNQLLARWMIKVPEKFAHFGDVCIFSLPHYLVWIAIATGFACFADRYILHSAGLHVVALNVLIVCGGIYFLQGLLIAAFYLRRLRARFLKMAVYVMIFMFIQVSAPVLAIVGFTDLWIDFRRLLRKESESGRNNSTTPSLPPPSRGRDKKGRDR